MQGLFRGGAVGGGAFQVTSERADLRPSDIGGGDGGLVHGGPGDEVDGLIGVAAGFGKVFGALAVGDEKQDEIVRGGGARLELYVGREALGGVDGLAADSKGFGIVVDRELLAVGVLGSEAAVEGFGGVGSGFLEVKADAGGDDGGGGVASRDDGAIGGLGVGIDGCLAEALGPGEGVDSGDVAGGVYIDLKLDRALDAKVFGVGGIDDGGEGEGARPEWGWGPGFGGGGRVRGSRLHLVMRIPSGWVALQPTLSS